MGDMFEAMLRQLSEPGGLERFQRREDERREAIERSRFRDDTTCDALGCPNSTQPCTQKCSKCKAKYYCSRECQIKAWREDGHKEECRYLSACQRLPLAKLPEPMESEDSGHTTVGFAATKSHGTHFYVMEKYEYHGSESNRIVVVGQTDQIYEKGVVSCIAEACMHPQYDTECGSGARRPASVRIYADTFPGGAEDPLVKPVAKIYFRFGSRPRIERFGGDNMEDGSWNFSWFCCQNQWLDEVTDSMWLGMIDNPRRRPLPPSGMARRGLESRDKEIPRLDVKDFPSRQSILRLPFSEDEMDMAVVAGTDGMVYVMNPSDGTLFYRKKLRLAKNRRPYVDDVLLCLYKAIQKRGVRPKGVWIGQPSICILQDVEAYESTLDESICMGSCMLMAQEWGETSLKNDWFPFWKSTGKYQTAGDD